MFEIYYSKDQGLLDNRIYLFKRQHRNVRHLRNLDSSELELALVQRNLGDEEEIGNLIIENYRGSFELLKAVIPFAKEDYENILMVQIGTPEKGLIGFSDNAEVEIKKLNENTKKGYINQLIKNRYSKNFPHNLLKLIKEKVPPCATSINELMENVIVLMKNGLLTDNILTTLLSTQRREPNFFNFFELYIDKEENRWFSFFNEFVVCPETLRKFSYSLTFKLLELKKFLSLRSKSEDLSRIASLMKVEKYSVSILNSYFKRHGERMILWLDEFIIDLYFLHSRALHSFSADSTILRYFLLRKRVELFGK
ncbi:hypothetical protein [Candidatus Mycoplasma haematohominis]|uniref:DNA polymerase III subunit delta n=1 Tax=Candidatus Mycoplasma haematohominis TaxID=1494318 RepID=A0A478FQN7_9MOLU|nr:hypothetical protein [Candidatus Mycoplasma haemohominis]GCE63821.1 hypothetical protein MHSWG343_08280 [Candidatus Mycoplasma haemohominis]